MADGSLRHLTAARTPDEPVSGEVETLRGHDGGVTRDRLDELFKHCADLGINVEWRDMGSTKRGEYDWREDEIRLNPRLSRRQTIACLAHELGHRAFGDRCSTPASERRAWEYAAAFLVTPVEYRRAEEHVGHHVAALAIELEVTPKVIEAWRRWWEKRGRLLHDLESGPRRGGEGC